MVGQAKPKLTSWKEIGAFLGRDARTVQRWERENHLPVHRVPGGRGYSVYAYPEELEVWLARGPAPAGPPEIPAKSEPARVTHPWARRRIRAGVLTAASAVLAVIALLAGGRLLQWRSSLAPSADSTLGANSTAYAEYLLGREAWNLRTRESLHNAIVHFGRAIERSPNYALAYSGLADTYLLLAFYNEPVPEVIPKARLAAMRALEFDPKRAEAHTSLAAIKALYNWDWSGAEQEFQRAIELNPRYATAHHWYGILLCAPLGRSAQTLAELERALELDPDSPIIRTDLGFAHYLAGQTDRAIGRYREVLTRDPNYIPAHFRLREAYELRGLHLQAFEEYLRNYQIPPSSPQGVEFERAFRAGGYAGFLRKVLDTVAQEAISVPSFSLARLYGKLGENEHAILWLEKACQEREPAVIYLQVDPAFAPLRSDPRFVRLERRIGLLP